MSGMGGEKYRVRCIGEFVWENTDGHSRIVDRRPKCGWTGVRTSIQCECYYENAHYCRPTAPGPGCPAGVIWPCPRCKGAVTGRLVRRRMVRGAP